MKLNSLTVGEAQLLRTWIRVTVKLLLLTPVPYELLNRELDAIQEEVREKLKHEN